MKVFFDTNVLISAILSSRSTPFKAIQKAAENGVVMVVSELNLQEMIRNVLAKFPSKTESLKAFELYLRCTASIVSVPERIIEMESRIRDEDDRPILRAAVAADVDIIVTGDKDFLESGIAWPMSMSPAEFLQYDLTPTDEPPRVAEP